MNKKPLLDVRNVTKVFSGGGGPLGGGRLTAVDDVSFTIPEDEAVIINLVGESGSGKTTLAHMLLRLEGPTIGEIRYRGRNIQHLSRSERMAYRREVQPVFQDPYEIYNPFYRVDRVLEKPLQKFHLLPAGVQRAAVIEEALRAVDLRPADVLGRYPHQLSGGERQRLMLARLFLIKPKLIIADEAVSMIDMSLRALFLNILLDFRTQLGISTLFITHNLATAHYLGGRLMIMRLGKIVEEGDLDAVISHPGHTYTQQLLASIPSPDPRHRWTEDLRMGEPEAGKR